MDDFETDFVLYRDKDRETFTLVVYSPVMLTDNDYIRELEYLVLCLKESQDLSIDTLEDCSDLN